MSLGCSPTSLYPFPFPCTMLGRATGLVCCLPRAVVWPGREGWLARELLQPREGAVLAMGEGIVLRGVTARAVREREGVVVKEGVLVREGVVGRERLDLEVGVLGREEGDRKSPNSVIWPSASTHGWTDTWTRSTAT